MKKKIKIADKKLEIRTTNQMVVEIDSLSFILDEEFPWITVRFSKDGEFHEDIDEIDILNEDGSVQVNSLEELKIVGMNWYFNNVKIVKDSDM
ncbi:hypothetical protein LPC27_12505 [Paraclostridium bifermentans]|uniref:hypothetical protein n=1 Tax=Paraclostridium bifermentans TaxID=1490 RepID=UPI001F295D7D|nr:hypothetical protein [Paraclostridium bifermentans]MCE9676588.1 hypothetical protein [Paraclostridium bifermentans]